VASASDTLQKAIALHQQGQLADAEGLYRQILASEPDHFDALHLLGVIRHQQGRHADALELIERALTRSPASAPKANAMSCSTASNSLGFNSTFEGSCKRLQS
jgi:tetratricopeptide (TPR) repeat protein